MIGTGFEDDVDRATPHGCAIIILGFFLLFSFISWAGRALHDNVATSPQSWTDTSCDTAEY